MNMKRISTALIGLLIVFSACQNKEKETPGGLKYTLVKDEDGPSAKPQEFVAFHFEMKDSKDSVWNNSYDNGMPGIMMIDSAQIKDDNLQQMFSTLSKGDSVIVKMPSTKFFRDILKQPLPPGVDSTRDLSLYISMHDVIGKDSIQNYYTRLMETKSKGQKSKDAKQITKYLADNNIKAQSDTSGLYYVVHNSSGSQKPTPENCVQVNYTGKLMKNGQVFDKNDGISFPLNGVIPGWQLGIPKLGIGDSATLYVPSHLAYGAQGVPGAIPPDAILIFDVELLSIGQEYDQASRSCK